MSFASHSVLKNFATVSKRSESWILTAAAGGTIIIIDSQYCTTNVAGGIQKYLRPLQKIDTADCKRTRKGNNQWVTPTKPRKWEKCPSIQLENHNPGNNSWNWKILGGSCNKRLAKKVTSQLSPKAKAA